MKNIQQYQDVFKQYLKDHPFDKKPRELYDAVDYILQLGGKRMRPVAVLMSYGLFKDNIERALPAAYAIEIFHNFSLIHDDVIDDAPLRRNQPTVHEKWNLNTSILSGDVMMVYAYEYLLQLENKNHLPSILATFNKAAIEVCEGQQYDINFELQTEVSIESYLKMIELKTSVLLAAAMKIGAIIADASTEDAEHLYQFGRKVGIAFQLQDDYLDTFGDPSKFGKKVGGDIIQNKKTFLILKALEVASPAVRNRLVKLINDQTKIEEAKIAAITRTLEELEIPRLTKEIKDRYQKEAFEHLDAVAVDDDRKVALKELAETLLDREV